MVLEKPKNVDPFQSAILRWSILPLNMSWDFKIVTHSFQVMFCAAKLGGKFTGCTSKDGETVPTWCFFGMLNVVI